MSCGGGWFSRVFWGGVGSGRGVTSACRFLFGPGGDSESPCAPSSSHQLLRDVSLWGRPLPWQWLPFVLFGLWWPVMAWGLRAGLGSLAWDNLMAVLLGQEGLHAWSTIQRRPHSRCGGCHQGCHFMGHLREDSVLSHIHASHFFQHWLQVFFVVFELWGEFSPFLGLLHQPWRHVEGDKAH